MTLLADRTDLATPAAASGATASVVSSAMEAARIAQASWAAIPVPGRLAHVRELRRLIAEDSSALAGASAAARGRPGLESLTAEVLPLAEACRFLERRAEVLLAPCRLGRGGRPFWLSGIRSEIHREPLGVVLIIGPGNYPLLLPGIQLVQALAAGNAVLLKPGAGGSLAARALVELVRRAGFDPGLVALLPDSTEAACAAIAARPDKVLFTGSAVTGAKILAQLAPHLVPATMELSGCDPVLVRGDADIDLVVRALVFGLTLNDGASCIAPRRVFVHRSIAVKLERLLARAMAGIGDVAGLGAESGGTLRRLVTDALGRGARLVAGRIGDDGSLAGPVILGDVAPVSGLLREDTFGPVMALVTVAGDAEALELANGCPYALGASIFTRDEALGRSLAAGLHAGVVTINDLIIPTADARLPFGGRRRSGFGVTRGAEGLLDLTAAKVVTVSRGRFRPAFEPAHPGDGELVGAYLRFVHGRGLASRGRALVALVKSLIGRDKPYTHPTS